MLKRSVCLFALCLAASLPARADEFTAAALGLCEKVKSCAMEQIAEEDLTPEMRQMMQPMLDNMCQNMQDKIEVVPADHPMYAPALACMRSMEALTCAMMQDPQQVKTPQCEAYEKLARESGSD